MPQDGSSQLADGNPPNLAGASMGGYYHACGFFRSRDEAYHTLLPFIREGMARGEKALHITNPALRDDHLRRLSEGGVDTRAAVANGHLEVLTWNQAYLKGGRFSPDAMLALLEQSIQADRAAGFARTRVIGDMGWALEKKPGVDQVMEYEARVNVVLAQHKEPAVCMYDIGRIDAETMLNLLRTHPLVVMGESLSVNPFYMPPDEFLETMRKH
jgi:hypothetical protein